MSQYCPDPGEFYTYCKEVFAKQSKSLWGLYYKQLLVKNEEKNTCILYLALLLHRLTCFLAFFLKLCAK